MGGFRLERQVGALGIVLWQVGFFSIDQGGSTPIDGAITVLVAELTRSPGRVVVGSIVGVIGCLGVLVLASAYAQRTGADQHLGGALGGAAAFGLVVVAVGGLAHGAIRLGQVATSDTSVLAEIVRTTGLIEQASLTVAFFGLVLTVVVLSTVARGLVALPIWAAVLGVTFAVVTVVLAPTDHGFGGLALLLWLTVVTVVDGFRAGSVGRSARPE